MRTVRGRRDDAVTEERPPCPTGMEAFYALNIRELWNYFKGEHFSFWMICGYLFIEYVRPQSIIPALDFLPWAQLFVLGALVGWLADPKKKWVKSPVNKWIILFFIAILVSSWLAFRPALSYSQLENFYTWMVIYFLIINIVNSRKRFFIFIFIFFLASFKLSASLARVWAFRGFSFTSWGLSGPPGFFQNSGELAIQMAVFWPMALAIALLLKGHVVRWKAWMLMAMPITAGMVILGSSSRGGQLALAAQLVTRYYKKIFKVKILIMLVAVILIGWFLLPVEQKMRFTEAGEDKTSQQRLLYWKNGLEMISDHPFFGVGYFNFIPYYERYYSEDMLYTSAELAHNIFIQVGADLGVFGLIAYLGILVAGVRVANSIRKDGAAQGRDVFSSKIAGAMNISLIGFVVAGQFVSVVYYPFLWIHLALVVSLRNVVDRGSA